MARLLADENFPQPAVTELRRLGHDILTVHDIGRAGQAWPDVDVLSFACNESRAVLTLNRSDFLRLHREGREHGGLVLCTFDRDFLGQAQRIHEALGGADDLSNALVRVNRPAR